MIESVSPSGMAGMQMRPPRGEDAKLTDDQVNQLQEIISNYDPENMTEDDMMSMMKEFKAAGIRPGEDMKNVLEDAGFELKRPEGMQRPEGMKGAEGQPPQFVTDFMEQFQAGETSEQDMLSFLEILKSQGEATTGLMVNQDS